MSVDLTNLSDHLRVCQSFNQSLGQSISLSDNSGICSSVRQSLCLSICLSVFWSIHLLVTSFIRHLSVHHSASSVNPSVHLLMSVFQQPAVSQSISHSVCLSFDPSIHQSCIQTYIHLSLSVHQSVS